MAVAIEPLSAADVAAADGIFRLAFGTFLGLPEPATFGGDSSWVATRWRADPEAALGAYENGELIGSHFAARWGSFGFFGPLSVRPDRWDRGVAKSLLGATMALFERWGTRQVGLFTFPQSAKHIGLYQRFGFWPGALTVLLGKPAAGDRTAGEWKIAAGTEEIAGIRKSTTEAIFPGLDLTREIGAVAEQHLGTTLVVMSEGRPVAFAVCHLGAGSEAGGNTLYVKFGAAAPGMAVERRFDRLLAAIETLAAERGMARVMAGVNTARRAAYRRALGRGYRPQFVGVAMQRPDTAGFNRSDCYVLDDWR